MNIVTFLFPRFRHQDEDMSTSAEQQAEVMRSLAQAKARLQSGRLAEFDAQVRSRNGGIGAE